LNQTVHPFLELGGTLVVFVSKRTHKSLAAPLSM
jgi:hypothetical protein